MAKYKELDLPFIEARNIGSKQKPTAIVIRISDTTSKKGAALGIATYHHRPNAPAFSHHYIVDESTTYRCISDYRAASASPWRSISVLLCMEPQAKDSIDELRMSLVVSRAAELVAMLHKIHKIPVRYLDTTMEKKWNKRHRRRRHGGIIVKLVGTWPYHHFLELVKLNMLEGERT